MIWVLIPAGRAQLSPDGEPIVVAGRTRDPAGAPGTYRKQESQTAPIVLVPGIRRRLSGVPAGQSQIDGLRASIAIRSFLPHPVESRQ